MDTLREELIRNYNDWGVTTYFFSDDTYNDNTEKLQQIARLSQSLPFALNFRAYIRIDLLRSHREQYQLLRDAGMVSAYFGLETFNHQSAKAIGKGLHPDKVIEELYRFAEELPHVSTYGSFIAGLPFETKDTLREWHAKIKAPDFPLTTYQLSPLFILKPEEVDEFYGEKRSDFTNDSSRWYTWQGHVWHNGDFDFNWAKQYCNEADADYKTSKRGMISMPSNLLSLNQHQYMASPAGRPSISTEDPTELVRMRIYQYFDSLFTDHTNLSQPKES